ncbi:MAG: galactose-1-phosphate uridylyltransferase, partial [Candidatus Omnitrophota bacterium]|nr:galactose-1-phosphate uridylyltransferase [Candidatus Omnitrophota bacterium]
MPELRKDPVIGRWVIISTERALRPDQFSNQPKDQENPLDCPFCEGKEAKTPPEIYAIRPHNSARNTAGWDLRVVPSIAPFL